MKILLLGTGLQGKAALHDLANSPLVSHIIAADANIDALDTYVYGLNTPKVTTVHLDVRDENRVAELMRSVQAVIALLPQTFRLKMAKLAVDNGVHYVETSYALPEYADLGRQAAAKDLTILPEFGLDPGMDLVLTGRAIRELDEVHELHVYGTGVPEPNCADNPLKYKISWTFAGVLGAYQRPARILKEGKVIDISPSEMFSERIVQTLNIEGLGVMESYPNGDAVKFLKIFGVEETTQNTGRYSLRWPGHSAFWKKLVDLGFLQDESIQVGDSLVSPRQFVHDLLLPQLQYREHERDIAAIRIDVRGIKGGRRKRVIYQMVDRRDLETGLLAMQRTVGYTASIGAQMILRGDVRKRGLLAPGVDVPSDIFIDELARRNIRIQRTELDW